MGQEQRIGGIGAVFTPRLHHLKNGGTTRRCSNELKRLEEGNSHIMMNYTPAAVSNIGIQRMHE